MDRGALRAVTVPVDGLAIHTRIGAAPVPDSAPTVVLVHGLGLSGRYMEPTAALLAARYRLLVPDLPGFGDSGKDVPALDVDQLADWLAAWARAADLGPAAWLGNSFGCQVIVALAQRHPALVRRAVLQGPTTDPRDRSWFWQFVRWRQNQPFNPPEMGPSTRGDYRKAGVRRLFLTTRAFLRDRVEDRLGAVRAPALVVRGALDPICRRPWAEEVTRRLPDARLVEIPGVAHTLCFTSPLELVRVSRPFIDGAA